MSKGRTGVHSTANPGSMLSALLMFQRVSKASRYAVREDEFLNVFFAGLFLVFIGTLSYALGADWNVVDALYFSVSTLTTSVSDPDLVLNDAWLKLFTVFYQLIGIGILVEILRRLGFAFVAVRARKRRPSKRREFLLSSPLPTWFYALGGGSQAPADDRDDRVAVRPRAGRARAAPTGRRSTSAAAAGCGRSSWRAGAGMSPGSTWCRRL